MFGSARVKIRIPGAGGLLHPSTLLLPLLQAGCISGGL